jgi:ubiquinone biosynthesis protein
MLLSIVNHDVPMLTRLIKRIGAVPPNLDEAGLNNDVADFVGHYSTQALDQFDLSGALTDMVEIIRRYQITLPTQVAMLIKVLVTLEGTTRHLSAKFSLMELMQPMQKKMLLRRLSPTRAAKKLRRLFVELEHLAEVMPQRLMQILEQVQSGKFDVHLDHRGLGPSVNRLVLGMLASALFMGSSLMLAHHVPPLLPNIPYVTTWFGLEKTSLLGLSGCSLSLLVGLRLLRAIGKSGHLDQKVSK